MTRKEKRQSLQEYKFLHTGFETKAVETILDD
jgi:hypothetical protein